jgi:hypothetical protein
MPYDPAIPLLGMYPKEWDSVDSRDILSDLSFQMHIYEKEIWRNIHAN